MSKGDDLRVIGGPLVSSILEGREAEILSAVERAYVAHGAGQTALPHSTFLRFPNDTANRIIALPAYIGGGLDAAGVKWIASFPANLDRGLDRASALIVLNSTETGHAQAVLEGSVISAKRTAASAALAAEALHGRQDAGRAGVIGCGYINFEISRFLRTVFPDLRELVAYDLVPERARHFALRCRELEAGVRVEIARSAAEVFQRTRLISIATTATSPHLAGDEFRVPGATVLHVSLRDLGPDVISAADNVVDDVDHVCRAQTSLHLVEQAAGNRDFIRCTLADVLTRRRPARASHECFSVFSPFGLGILDVAVAKLVYERAAAAAQGTTVESFLPRAWHAGALQTC